MSFRFAMASLAVLGFAKTSSMCAMATTAAGAQVVVDTDDTFHTYRLEALGRGTASSMCYDGNLVMSG